MSLPYKSFRAERFKTSLQFFHLPYRNLYAALDACKVADYVLFVLSPSVEVDAWGDMLLRALQAQGLPHVVACVSPSPAQEDKKSRAGILKSLLSFIQYFVPSLTRVFDLGAPSDCAYALRALCEGHPTDVRWRTGRPWLLAEDVRWEAPGGNDNLDASTRGRLHVTGVIRGAPFSANRLVHIPEHGDYQVEKIVSAPLPRHNKGSGPATSAMEIEPSLLAEPDPEDADSLVSTNVPDDLANEQTWPTEDEMKNIDEIEDEDREALPDAGKGTTPRRVKRVPKGWSDYQAAWIVDEEEDGEDDEGDEGEDDSERKAEGNDMDDEDVGMNEVENGRELEQEEEETVELPESEVDDSGRRGVHFQDLDIEEETRQYGLPFLLHFFIFLFWILLALDWMLGAPETVQKKKQRIQPSQTK